MPLALKYFCAKIASRRMNNVVNKMEPHEELPATEFGTVIMRTISALAETRVDDDQLKDIVVGDMP